jgi:hypothetical protein
LQGEGNTVSPTQAKSPEQTAKDAEGPQGTDALKKKRAEDGAAKERGGKKAKSSMVPEENGAHEADILPVIHSILSKKGGTSTLQKLLAVAIKRLAKKDVQLDRESALAMACFSLSLLLCVLRRSAFNDLHFFAVQVLAADGSSFEIVVRSKES